MNKERDHHSHLHDHGDFRLERRWKQEEDGGYLWTVYKRVPTGAEEGKPGVHPVITSDKGTPIDTTESYVWIELFTGSEAKARERYDAERN